LIWTCRDQNLVWLTHVGEGARCGRKISERL
jgi:hypothetical protein